MVTVKVSDTVPMVSVVVCGVKYVPAETFLNLTVLPLTTVPLTRVYAPPLIEYVPLTIEIGVAALIPDTVMALEVITLFNATPLRSIKVNGSGVVSEGAGVVNLTGVDVSRPISFSITVDAAVMLNFHVWV